MYQVDGFRHLRSLVADGAALSTEYEHAAIFARGCFCLKNRQAFVYFLVGVVMFKNGVTAYSTENDYDYAPCLSAMNACRPLLLEAARLASMKVSIRRGRELGSVRMTIWACSLAPLFLTPPSALFVLSTKMLNGSR